MALVFNKMKKVSVVVPVYNVEKYVKKCLESIKNQTLEDFECLIVNDGTKDNSIEVAKEVTKNDHRFKYYDKENGGLSDARNFAIDKAKGEYICFIDSDDYIDNRLLELSYNKAKQYDSDIVCFDLYYEKEDGKLEVSSGVDFKDVSNYKDNKDIVFSNNSANNKLYKTSFLKDKRFIKGMWYEDMAVIPVWIAKANNMSYVKEPLYYYVQREGSISHSADPRIFDIYNAISNVKEELNVDSKDVKSLYFDNCLIMTTLRIKEIEDKKTRIDYYKQNVDLLDFHYPSWFMDSLKENYTAKQKLIFFMIKFRMINLLNKVYSK